MSSWTRPNIAASLLCALIAASITPHAAGAEPPKKHCVACQASCFTLRPPVHAAVQAKVAALNASCLDDCVQATRPASKFCANDPCYSALAVLQLKLRFNTPADGAASTASSEPSTLVQLLEHRHYRHDCIPVCPKPGVVCDLQNLGACAFPKGADKQVEHEVRKGEAQLLEAIGAATGAAAVDVLSKSGELHCCVDDGCNRHTKMELAPRDDSTAHSEL